MTHAAGRCWSGGVGVAQLVRCEASPHMDDWAWEQLAPCLKAHVELPIVPLFCVVNGAKGGRRREVGTSIYLPGIDNAEIIDAVHSRRAPLVPVHSSLRL